MKSVLIAVWFLLASSQVEAGTTGCSTDDLNRVGTCLQSAGIDLSMFSDVANYMQAYRYICANERITAAIACLEVVVDKCKDDKSLGIGSALMSQIDFDNVRAAYAKGCSHIDDMEGQKDCIDSNSPALVACSTNLGREFSQKIILNPNPSQNEVAQLMCSAITGANECIYANLESCGKVGAVLSDFMEAYRPKKSCP